MDVARPRLEFDDGHGISLSAPDFCLGEVSDEATRAVFYHFREWGYRVGLDGEPEPDGEGQADIRDDFEIVAVTP